MLSCSSFNYRAASEEEESVCELNVSTGKQSQPDTDVTDWIHYTLHYHSYIGLL